MISLTLTEDGILERGWGARTLAPGEGGRKEWLSSKLGVLARWGYLAGVGVIERFIAGLGVMDLGLGTGLDMSLS